MTAPRDEIARLLCVGLLVGCSGTPELPPQTPQAASSQKDGEETVVEVPVIPQTSSWRESPREPDESPPAPPEPLAESATEGIDRGELVAVLDQGPAWLLQRVSVEEVLKAGTLRGWRIVELPPSWSVDLQAGDIVTVVNDQPMASPADLAAVWSQLGEAHQLKIAYERQGQKRVLSIPIVDP